MADTPHLLMPEIEAGEAGLVNHNEALRTLDSVVQLAVKDRSLTAPPGSPAEGDRYIVAAAPTGEWTGHALDIAAWDGGAWLFHEPREGWRAWVDDEDALLIFDGAAWIDVGSAIKVLQNLTLLGIGTTADATNPFSAKLNKALWTAKTAAEGGDGDLRVTLNKEAAADVLSLLMQRGFSGRAELGLIGDDDFTLKVSPDGSAWATAMVVDKDDGTIKTVAGSAAAPAISVGTVGDGLYQISSGLLGLSLAGTARASFANSKWIFNGTTFESLTGASNGFQIQGTSGGVGSFYNIVWQSGSVSGPVSYFAKSRGAALNTHAIVQNGDQIGRLRFYGDDGATWIEAARISVEVDATPGVNDMPANIIFSTTADGASAVTERMRLDSAGNLQMGGTNTVVDSNRHVRLRSYTIATLPSASPAGQMITCSDLGGGGGQLNADGTNWRRVSRGGHQAVATDAAFTLTPLTSAEEQKHTGTLTANRVVTLSTTNAYSGARFRVTRTGAGAFNLDIGGLKNLATNTWGEVIYDGAAWYLAAYGAL